jgi:glycosyltransferase involved in cell wall biosynthesis
MTNDAKGKTDAIKDTLISVIIPVYNSERYVGEAIESVLGQKHKNIEIIAVNDGSTDCTEDVVRSYKNVKLFSQSRKGVSSARNIGVKNSSGEFIAFLDADDLWTKKKLKIQQTIFMNNPDLDMVFGHVEQFFSPELADSSKNKIKMITGAMAGYISGAMLIRRTSFLKAGLFDEGVRLGEFIDWYIRAVDVGLKSVLSPEIVLKRRIHDENTGIRDREYRRDYLRVLKISLDRRRNKEKKVETSA